MRDGWTEFVTILIIANGPLKRDWRYVTNRCNIYSNATHSVSTILNTMHLIYLSGKAIGWEYHSCAIKYQKWCAHPYSLIFLSPWWTWCRLEPSNNPSCCRTHVSPYRLSFCRFLQNKKGEIFINNINHRSILKNINERLMTSGGGALSSTPQKCINIRKSITSIVHSRYKGWYDKKRVTKIAS